MRRAISNQWERLKNSKFVWDVVHVPSVMKALLRRLDVRKTANVMLEVSLRALVAWLLTSALVFFVANRVFGQNPFEALRGFAGTANARVFGSQNHVSATSLFDGRSARYVVALANVRPYSFSIGRASCGLTFAIDVAPLRPGPVSDVCRGDGPGANQTTYKLAELAYPPIWATNTVDITLHAHVDSLMRVFGEGLDTWLSTNSQQLEARDREELLESFGAFLRDREQLDLETRLRRLKRAMFFNGTIQFLTAWVFFYGLVTLFMAGRLGRRRVLFESPVMQFIVGVIPMIGFYGTIIGIAASLEAVGLTKSVNPIISTVADAQITSGIGVAFETTKFAIVLTVVLGWLVALVDRGRDAG